MMPTKREQLHKHKHEAILKAALELFLENGYAQTKVDAIAERAHVSTRTLYKHFTGKEALFSAIVEEAWAFTALENVNKLEGVAPFIALTQIGSAYADLLMRPTMVELFQVIIAEVSRFPQMGEELYRRGKEPFLTMLHDYLGMQVEKRVLDIDDIPLSARQFLGMINDVLFWPRFLVLNLTFDEAECQRVVSEAAKTFLARYSTGSAD